MPESNFNNHVTRVECSKNTETLMTDIKEVKEKIEKININLASLPEKLMEKFEEKFASKKTETIVYGIICFIGVSLVGIIGYLLDKYVLR